MLLFYGLLMLMLEKGSGDCLNGKNVWKGACYYIFMAFWILCLVEICRICCNWSLDHELIIGGFVRFQWKGEVAVLFTMDNHFIWAFDVLLMVHACGFCWSLSEEWLRIWLRSFVLWAISFCVYLTLRCLLTSLFFLFV